MRSGPGAARLPPSRGNPDHPADAALEGGRPGHPDRHPVHLCRRSGKLRLGLGRVVRSRPVSCLDQPAYAAQWTTTTFASAVRSARRWDAACQAHSGDVLPYLGTEYQARDLDLLRAAVGDPKLTYFGDSYATYGGTVYASMFPGRTRALVLDSGYDPEKYARDVYAFDYGQYESTEAAMYRFLGWCAATPDQCAFAADFPLTAPRMAYGPPAYDQTHAPACVQWPAARRSRYTGSYRAHGSAPILISGNTGDPDTPYADSVALARILENGHLITWAGEGHTARRKSACIEAYMYDYLLRLTVPPAGTVCRDAPISWYSTRRSVLRRSDGEVLSADGNSHR